MNLTLNIEFSSMEELQGFLNGREKNEITYEVVKNVGVNKEKAMGEIKEVVETPLEDKTPPTTATEVPTQEVTYTTDELANAAVSLMDNGKQEALVALLAEFNVTSLPELKPEQYGLFATKLRELGANI